MPWRSRAQLTAISPSFVGADAIKSEERDRTDLSLSFCAFVACYVRGGAVSKSKLRKALPRNVR
jgi:hypothetical protein